MQTGSPEGGTSENTAVLRVSQQVVNPFSSVGGMVTSRVGSDRGANLAYGLDAVLRPVGDEWFTATWARTFDSAVDEATALDAGLALFRWERVRDEGFSYRGECRRVGRDYLPRLGFQDRRDYRFLGGDGQFKRFQGPESPFRSRAVRLVAEAGYPSAPWPSTATRRSLPPSTRASGIASGRGRTSGLSTTRG
jgi:hypothetical protein